MAQTITLSNNALTVLITISSAGHPFLTSIRPTSSSNPFSSSPSPSNTSLPLIEIRLSNEGTKGLKSSSSLIGSALTSRLIYLSHHFTSSSSSFHNNNRNLDDDSNEANNDTTTSQTLNITVHDPKTNIQATAHLTIFPNLPILRSNITIQNKGSQPLSLTSCPSLIIGGLTTTKEWYRDYELLYANNTWFREAQWTTHSLPSLGLDSMGLYPDLPDAHASLATFTLANHSSFSTQGHLPMGILRRRVTDTNTKQTPETWIWQIESSGSWKWEVGDYKDGLYLAASGPDGEGHEFRQVLQPGEEFTTVPVAVGHFFDDEDNDNLDKTFSHLTSYRRTIRLPHKDHQHLPIIFNDYMNCLMGNPTTPKIQALIPPVAASGAEYFVIDAGWYSDSQSWWHDVGTWEPSQKRFQPHGFKALLEEIRSAGMIPGLWIEPEVVGVNNTTLIDSLPREAFFERDGQKVTEKGRHHLDFRCPTVVEHMDRIITKYIQEYKVGYFKFDYNLSITQSTDLQTSSPGAAHLAHTRAYLSWISSLLTRHPTLLIENCSSGGQRLDYAMLALHPIQSTSDQESPLLYAAISANIHTAVTPEQGASWAYPQPDWSDDLNAFTVVNTLLGRVHLSGRLDLLSPHQLEIVYSGMRVYQSIRADIPTSLPFWPLGLADWHADWLCLGLRVRDAQGEDTGKYYLAVWRRGGGVGVDLPMKFAKFEGKSEVKVERLYPTNIEGSMDGWWENGRVIVEAGQKVCAALFVVEMSCRLC